ncbi:hypothetical protein BC827DRAFT_1206481 [Russula dissimulans]|nr:hypothetical protein BC827DRAFT_1206481 [Russula dissimulans]
MNTVIGTSIGGATPAYEIIAVFGYLTFGSRICYSHISRRFFVLTHITDNLPSRSSSSYPLQVHPCRNCPDKVFHFGSANDKLEDDAVEDEHAPGEMSPLKHTLLTTAVVFGGFSIAYFVDNIEMVLSFVGVHRVDDNFVHSSSFLDCSTGS